MQNRFIDSISQLPKPLSSALVPLLHDDFCGHIDANQLSELMDKTKLTEQELLLALLPIAAALAISNPRAVTIFIASLSEMIVARDAAVISPTEWPETTDGVTPSALKLNKPAATIRGWAFAVSLISSASAEVPRVKRSIPISRDQAAHVSRSVESFSQALSIPGDCDP